MGIGPGEVNDLVRSIDILPTILSYLDIEYDTEMQRRVEGKSLEPLIETSSGTDSTEYAITEKRVRDTDALRIGIRTEAWSFIYDGMDNSFELYDLGEDTEEQTNVSGDPESPLTRFETIVEERFEQIEQTSEDAVVPDLQEDVEVEERLRALGYKD
jgi:arylsulfatase A-like enzyme